VAERAPAAFLLAGAASKARTRRKVPKVQRPHELGSVARSPDYVLDRPKARQVETHGKTRRRHQRPATRFMTSARRRCPRVRVPAKVWPNCATCEALEHTTKL
jgi:hypothetical protein